jgi:hypothetical protein
MIQSLEFRESQILIFLREFVKMLKIEMTKNIKIKLSVFIVYIFCLLFYNLYLKPLTNFF